MNQEKKKRLYTAYSAVLSVAIVVVGLLLMAACLQIYLSGGEQIYTPEKVAVAFGRIAVPVYICLGLILVGFVLHFALRQGTDKAPKIKNPAMQLRRMLLTRDSKQADPEKQASLRRLRRSRRILLAICIVLCAAWFILFASFALINSTFYPDAADATKYVISLMRPFTTCTVLSLGWALVTTYLSRQNMEKQIALYKQCPPLAQPKKAGRSWLVVRLGLLVVAVFLIVFGLISGGWQDVLTKAINICTECVGLG